MTAESDRLNEILRAVARGWHIFPAVPDAKRPFVDQWEPAPPPART